MQIGHCDHFVVVVKARPPHSYTVTHRGCFGVQPSCISPHLPKLAHRFKPRGQDVVSHIARFMLLDCDLYLGRVVVCDVFGPSHRIGEHDGMEVFVAGGDSASDDDSIDVEFGLGQRVTAWHIPAKRERPCAVFRTYARLRERGIELVGIRNAPTTVAMRRQFGDHLEQ